MSRQIDMCHGPLLRQIVCFTLPVMATHVLQICFNAADIAVLGRFASAKALASVGSVSILANVMVAFFCGVAVGVNVIIARAYGARKFDVVSRAVHTSVFAGLVFGALGIIACYVLARPLILLQNTPEEIQGGALTYLRIYGLGVPFMILYNIAASILRSVGDTRRPMIYMTLAGVTNLVMNLIFVLGFHWDVAGVAWATTISQGLAAFLIYNQLCHEQGCCRLIFRKIRCYWKELKAILVQGLPGGLQSSSFGISNMIIQSSINSFGSMAIAASTACYSLEHLADATCAGFYSATVSFVGQNYGGRQYGRMRRAIFLCGELSMLAIFIQSIFIVIFRVQIMRIFVTDLEAISFGTQRIWILIAPYALCSLMDTVSAGLRGLGHTLLSAVSILLCACVFRTFWVLWVMPLCHSWNLLMICYPISWILAFLLNGIFLWWLLRPYRDIPESVKYS